MKFDRNIIAFPISLVIITGLFFSISNASDLKLEHSLSSRNPKDLVIGLKATNVKKEGDKINAEVVLWNSTQTWIFIEQNFNSNKVGQFPVHTQGAYLLGPGYTKNLGTVEFSKGSFLQFNAKTATGVGHRLGSPESNMLLGALAIDLAMRGFFSKELPPNAFDRPLVLPIEVGMASIDPLFYTITSHCSGTLGVLSKAITMKDADKAIEALGKFLICTMEAPIREKIKDWLIKLFSKEVAEKWARKFVGSLGDFLNLPMKATLIGILTKYTLGAPSESWARVEAVEVKDVAQPQITSSLKITPHKNKYQEGDVLFAEFNIANKSNSSISFDVLTVGGRVNDICPNDKCPDFEWKRDVTLKANESYTYKGKIKLESAGDHHFFTAYKTKDGWNTNITTAPEVTNTKDIYVEETKKAEPSTDFSVCPKSSEINQKIQLDFTKWGWKNPIDPEYMYLSSFGGYLDKNYAKETIVTKEKMETVTLKHLGVDLLGEKNKCIPLDKPVYVYSICKGKVVEKFNTGKNVTDVYHSFMAVQCNEGPVIIYGHVKDPPNDDEEIKKGVLV